LSLKNIGVVNVEFYTDVDERLDVPGHAPPALDLADIANCGCSSSTTWPTPADAEARGRHVSACRRRASLDGAVREALLGHHLRIRGATPTSGSTSVVGEAASLSCGRPITTTWR
jgi:hypothetical protein